MGEPPPQRLHEALRVVAEPEDAEASLVNSTPRSKTARDDSGLKAQMP
jgi:hypothetical protein